MSRPKQEECLEEMMEKLEKDLQRDATDVLWGRYYRLKKRRFVILRYLRLKLLLKKIRYVIGSHGQ